MFLQSEAQKHLAKVHVGLVVTNVKAGRCAGQQAGQNEEVHNALFKAQAKVVPLWTHVNINTEHIICMAQHWPCLYVASPSHLRDLYFHLVILFVD